MLKYAEDNNRYMGFHLTRNLIIRRQNMIKNKGTLKRNLKSEQKCTCGSKLNAQRRYSFITKRKWSDIRFGHFIHRTNFVILWLSRRTWTPVLHTHY
jgi:hypothetical protein